MPARTVRLPRLAQAILVFAVLGSLVPTIPGAAASANGTPTEDLTRALTLALPVHRSWLDLGEASAEDQSASSGGIALRARDSIQTPDFYALVASLEGGPDGAFVRVHGYGDVAATDGAGEPIWTRSARSFSSDWGVEPTIPPLVLVGASPLNPFVLAGERPYAVGDLTGDGVDDVAVAHVVRPAHFVEDPGDAIGFLIDEYFSEVTVLDGRDGTTVWHERFPGYVTQLVAAGDVLVVADETGNVIGGDSPVGENGSTSELAGFRFEERNDETIVTEAWARSTGKPWARWIAAEPIAGDGVAFSWSASALGAPGTKGQVMLVDAASGAVEWSVPTAGYARTIRHDESRDLVVVHELADPGLRLDYTLRGLRVADGSEAITISRPGAVLISMAVADVASPGDAEWITADLEQLPVTPVAQSSRTYVRTRVVATDPGSGAEVWSHVVPAGQELAEGRGTGLASNPTPYGMVVAGGRVVLGSLSQLGHGLLALNGADGTEAWERFGDPAFPLSLSVLRVASSERVLGITQDHVARLFAPDDGRIVLQAPVLSNIQAVGVYDVNGDGTSDLVVGTRSGGVWALDGGRIADHPGVLWKADAGSPVHEIQLADLDGDTGPELVVAASRGVEVLSVLDGSSRYRLDYPAEDLVWTVAVGDLDGDARPDLVVPTRTLAGFRGADGSPLWEFAPPEVRARFSTTVITSDRRVVSQAMVHAPVNAATGHYRLAVGLEGDTGDVAWALPQAGPGGGARLWQTVAAGPPAASGGTEVAMTWGRATTPLGAITPEHPVVDVVDSATGQVLYTSGLISDGQITQGTFHDPEYGFIQYDRFGTARVTPAGTQYVEFPTFVDLDIADFGPAGRTVLGTYHLVTSHPGDGLSGSQGPAAPQTGRWDRLESGRMHVADIDGDGVDEVITMAFDWPAYLAVSAFSQAASPWNPPVFHMGLAVLEAEPGS